MNAHKVREFPHAGDSRFELRLVARPATEPDDVHRFLYGLCAAGAASCVIWAAIMGIAFS